MLKRLNELFLTFCAKQGVEQKTSSFFALLGAYCRERFPYIAGSDLNDFFSASVFEKNSLLEAVHFLRSTSTSLAGIDCREFGYLYETLQQRSDLKKRGVFYTPRGIAASIATRTIAPVAARETYPICVLDPACGCGTFLAEAFAQLQLTHPDVSPSIALEQCLFGVDIDPHAVAICRVILQILLLEIAPKKNVPDLTSSIRQGNALIDPESLDGERVESIEAFSFQHAFPSVMNGGGFHCIIGNPPYGLSRGEQLSAVENAVIKRRFADLRDGKANKYMLFMALAMQLLRNGGRCSFIVPNSWLGIAGASKLRRRLFDDGAIEEIEILTFPAFNEPSVETVIFTIDTAARKESIRVSTTDRPDDLGRGKCTDVRVEDCMRTPGGSIPVCWDKSSPQLLRAIEELCVPLREMRQRFIPLIALQAYATGKGTPPQSPNDVKEHVFHSRSKLTPNDYPYLEGVDVGRYKLGWSGRFLRYGPWLAEYHPIERFSGPRILIREILGRTPYLLSCAYADHTALYNRSVLHIIGGPTGRKEDMFALLALLNSTTASQLIMLLGQKAQRSLFPKVVNADLLNFPVPSNWERFAGELAPLGRRRLSMTQVTKDSAEASRLDQLIDEKIAAFFRLVPAVQPLQSVSSW